jgi:hypothetical protein
MTATPPSNADDTSKRDDDPPRRTDEPTSSDPQDCDPAPGVIAVVEEYDDGPDECTIYPDGDTRRLLTEWISAEEGSFVSLDEMR